MSKEREGAGAECHNFARADAGYLRRELAGQQSQRARDRAEVVFALGSPRLLSYVMEVSRPMATLPENISMIASTEITLVYVNIVEERGSHPVETEKPHVLM